MANEKKGAIERFAESAFMKKLSGWQPETGLQRDLFHHLPAAWALPWT